LFTFTSRASSTNRDDFIILILQYDEIPRIGEGALAIYLKLISQYLFVRTGKIYKRDL
jgi:hypothetical protein